MPLEMTLGEALVDALGDRVALLAAIVAGPRIWIAVEARVSKAMHPSGP